MASSSEREMAGTLRTARRKYSGDLLRRYRATENPFVLIEALLSGAQGEIEPVARKWLRGSLAKTLGVALGARRGKTADIAKAFGIEAKHIREAHAEFRDAAIRRGVRARADKETLEDAVVVLADGVPGGHGPVIRGLSKGTIARIAKSKSRKK